MSLYLFGCGLFLFLNAVIVSLANKERDLADSWVGAVILILVAVSAFFICAGVVLSVLEYTS